MNDDPLFDIAGKVVVVTGAASGLGRAFAGELARRGAVVERVDRHRPGDGDTSWHVADITDAGRVAELMKSVVDRHGRLDALVNSAGLFAVASARDMAVDDFRRLLDVNVTGAFVVSQAAAKVMPQGGRIVHLSSVSSQVSNERYAAYASSKAALSHLVRVLAREWAPAGVTVNAIGPAMTETGLTGSYLADAAAREAALSVIPMRRFGTPEDLFGALLLLIAKSGEFITGQTIYVDGGRTLV
jgi:NAD(P)-dependent dehydrogenase (short-subunit alcohol dehydrogenase family)